jgi:hypothetical protein
MRQACICRKWRGKVETWKEERVRERKKHERKEENYENDKFKGPPHSSFFYPEDGGSRFL